jgi:hypothetical protein
VADANSPAERDGVTVRVHRAYALEELNAAPIQHSHAVRVIPAIGDSLERTEQDGERLFGADIPYDPAHVAGSTGSVRQIRDSFTVGPAHYLFITRM